MMTFSRKYCVSVQGILAVAIGVFALLSDATKVSAQQKPPRPIAVYFNPGAGLRFGAFFQSTSGGTVIMSSGGLRTFTGSVVGAGLGVAYGAAEFDIDAEPGTQIAILNGPDATLYGSSGGTMTLHIGSSYPASPFITTVTPPAQTAVKIGGTLTVGSPIANPSGTYSGSFVITFIQE
jgi:uncharacterized protein DUF4402